MSKVLICTGKKKKIQAVADYYSMLQKNNKIKVLARRLKTKKALFWSYDELRILFDPTFGSRAPVPEKLLNSLDYHAFREQAALALEFRSPLVEDKMLKVKILTVCHTFVSKGVRAKVNLKEKKESEYRVYYQCFGQLSGAAGHVLACKEQLIHENLCEQESLTYIF